MNHHTSNTILLAGSGRSGTTWVAETIIADRSRRFIFEPFKQTHTKKWKKYSYIQYLRRDDDDPNTLQIARKILSGKIHNDWIDQFNESIFTRKRLVKEVTANLMLAWIRENFPEIPIIFIIRHPLAVTASKLELKWDPSIWLESIRQQPQLIEDFLEPLMPEIEKHAADPFAIHLITWCIENHVPFKQLRPEEYCLIKYENLLFGGTQEIKKIFDYLNIPLTQVHLDQFGKLSKSMFKSTNDPTNPKHLQPWVGKLTDQQLTTAKHIFNLFDVKAWLPYYPLL